MAIRATAMRATTMRRPTLELVAAHAGVSRATVSRVVNGSGAVAPELRERVARTVAELGYVPNHSARSLVTRRTDSIAVILSGRARRLFTDDPYVAGLIRGIVDELDSADKQLVLLTADPDAGPGRIERYAAGRHVDGAIVVSHGPADPLPDALARLGLPVVRNGRPTGRPTVPYVDVTHEAGAREAVEHLIDRGCQRVATIAGPPDSTFGRGRLAGYRAAVRDRGHRPIVAVGDFGRESGLRAMRKLISSGTAPDGVFAASDAMADGALAALRQAGRRVPDDVAVIGFDDHASARYSEPPLTTVRQPVDEVGAMLARQLLRALSGEWIEPALVLRTELVVRESA